MKVISYIFNSLKSTVDWSYELKTWKHSNMKGEKSLKILGKASLLWDNSVISSTIIFPIKL